nr:reverse transcriptase domain-containing protein [Tanacetum cinerariifolium]
MTGGLLRGTLADNIGPTPVGVIGSTLGGTLEVNVKTPLTETTPSAREQIEGHLSALRSLLKEHNGRGNVSPIRLSFDDVEDRTRVRTVVTGKEIGDAEGGRSIDGWVELRQQFTTRFLTRRACFKDRTKITKIVRKDNETLVAFKERWIVETGFITGVPEVMKISSFMDAHKVLELAKRYSDKVSKTVDEMMTRLDDFVRSKEAVASTDLPKGEASEASRKLVGPVNKREDRFHKGGYKADRFNLGSLAKLPKEIMASEPQLNLQPPTPMQLSPKKKHQDKYCDYHGEKGHYTNDCFQLRRQLEMALESGKLNHLIKDVRQRGRGNVRGRDAGKDKVINMIRLWPNDKKRKSVKRDESWMKAPIVFPPLLMEDASNEPLIIEAVKEGFLVHRVYVDQGASVEMMFEHCFENLSPVIRSRLRGTQMDLVGFAGGVVKPLGEIELEVVFGDESLFRTVMINFTVVRAPSPYNVIFGRTGLRSLRAVSSTIHSMEVNQNINQEKEVPERVDLIEQTFVNPAYPDQLVIIGGSLSAQYIDQKIKSVVGFRYKCFLDAYKGYHQVRMAHDDEEKTAFYTDQDTYCYTKMPFRLKNARATYRRLVDTTFHSQIERNLEAYVDDMVIKSNDEKVLIEYIVETFDNLRRINMKLNPKKCSFGVEEGNFLGSLPFFETLKDITKENKDEYCWTESTEKAFQEIKKVIVELPLLTTLVKEETLYVYVSEATEVVSVVLLAERKGKQCLIYYVSRTLNEAERNYVPLEKLALSLLHLSRRLQKYFEAHPIKVITDHPLKQILNKAQSSGKLAKYSVELGAYNITYEPRKAMKGQFPNKDDVERWTLFTDGASNSKGSEAGLVLISPSYVEFTYALWLNFTSMNNEAEYEALLAGLRMERKMKVQNIDVKVDSKLVASQINGSYVASSTGMIKYLATTKECIAEFKTFDIQNIPRNSNQKADILSKLAT